MKFNKIYKNTLGRNHRREEQEKSASDALSKQPVHPDDSPGDHVQLQLDAAVNSSSFIVDDKLISRCISCR